MEIAGFDAVTIVEQLMEIERLPLSALETRKTRAQDAANALAQISSKVTAFLGSAQRLASLADFERSTTSVSDTSIVAATAGTGATPGSLSFTVDRLATSEGLRSVQGVASTSVAITTDSLLAVAAGTRSIGVASVRAGSGLGAGTVELSVVQSSAAASSTGTTPLAASTTISASNDSLLVEINGAAHSLTIAAGTYTADELVGAIQTALDGAGVAATASRSAGGALVLSTDREGSAATLQVTGGTSLGDLGLGVDLVARTGIDGVFDVGGTQTTVTSIEAGTAVAVDTGSGTLDVTLSGGLRVGDADIDVVDVGDGSLAEVVTAINTAKNGVGAAAVRVADGNWVLQLSATKTGENGRIAIDAAAFAGAGGLVQTSAAQDARITIGTGPGAYSIDSSTNTFTDVMGGVTLTAKSVSTQAVTVNVTRDDATIVADVGKLVSAANDIIGQIKVLTRTDPTARTSGPLAGSPEARALTEQVRAALTNQISGLGYLPSELGIEREREGGIKFDETKFRAALENDPEGVARIFSRGGTTSGDAVFAAASKTTTTGSYDVVVTTAASRASSATLFDGGAVASTRVGVRIGSLTVTYDVSAGQSRDAIVDGLNAALADAGLDIIAEDDGTGLRIRAGTYGSAGDFELNTDVAGVGTWDAVAGTDVVGTIGGVAATGVGRRLSLLDTADSPAAGLAVDVEAGFTGTSTVEYRPGIAGRVAELAEFLTREGGTLNAAETSANDRVDDFNDQISKLEDRLFTREANLRRQWASLQQVLGQLQSQGSWLSGQLATLPSNWSGG